MKNLFFYHLFFLYFSFCEDLKKDKNIFILNPDNFDNTLKKYPIALVEFYYIKCIHCKDFEPTFSKIGDLYNNNEEKNKNNIIAQIDDTEYIDFTKKI
jgi:thiol-disulfide isomerase/thioredoxin